MVLDLIKNRMVKGLHTDLLAAWVIELFRGPPRGGQQLYFAYPSAPDPFFKVSKAPFLTIRVATPWGHPVKHRLTGRANTGGSCSTLVGISQKGSPERCRFWFFPFFSVFFLFSVFFRFFRFHFSPFCLFFSGSDFFRFLPFSSVFFPFSSVSFSEINGETPFARPLLRNPDLAISSCGFSSLDRVNTLSCYTLALFQNRREVEG